MQAEEIFVFSCQNYTDEESAEVDLPNLVYADTKSVLSDDNCIENCDSG